MALSTMTNESVPTLVAPPSAMVKRDPYAGWLEVEEGGGAVDSGFKVAVFPFTSTVYSMPGSKLEPRATSMSTIR